MTETTIFVGLDVHKKTIAVATVEGRASADVRFDGTIANTPEAIRSLLRKLGKGGQRLHLAYEAGPLGYNLYRLSTGLGHPHVVTNRKEIDGGRHRDCTRADGPSSGPSLVRCPTRHRSPDAVHHR